MVLKNDSSSKTVRTIRPAVERGNWNLGFAKTITVFHCSEQGQDSIVSGVIAHRLCVGCLVRSNVESERGRAYAAHFAVTHFFWLLSYLGHAAGLRRKPLA